jgi:hypothetical protein
MILELDFGDQNERHFFAAAGIIHQVQASARVNHPDDLPIVEPPELPAAVTQMLAEAR